MKRIRTHKPYKQYLNDLDKAHQKTTKKQGKDRKQRQKIKNRKVAPWRRKDNMYKNNTTTLPRPWDRDTETKKRKIKSHVFAIKVTKFASKRKIRFPVYTRPIDSP